MKNKDILQLLDNLDAKRQFVPVEKRDIRKIFLGEKKHRDGFARIQKFVDNNENIDGNILVLYGLRRTGKTTLMEQILEAYREKEKCAYYVVQEGATVHDIEKVLIEERKNGTTIIGLDEITRAKDFTENSSSLPDIFAKEGMKIIVTGTDSLGFLFAEERPLYNRTVRVNTTYIPFAEHCRVLGINDMDDYIQYGGLMKPGESEERIVNDYESACKHLDSAVADNIVNSIAKDGEDNCLDVFSKEELRTIIEKVVELYSGSFAIKKLQNQLTNVAVNYAIDKLHGIADIDIIERLTANRPNITEEFAQIINAGTEIKHKILPEMIQKLQGYLFDMNLLSVTKKVPFTYSDELGWREGVTTDEFYIIQPAIKYYHLQKGKEFIEKEDYYNELSQNEKRFMQKKLDEKIKGDMTEQIVIFDTMKSLPASQYFVCKPVFSDNGRQSEYDMLVYDKEENRYWGFEVKHTENSCYEQEKHIQNEHLREAIDRQYGSRENVAVLYRGVSFVAPSGTMYFNVTDFMLAVFKYKNMEKVFAELTKDLSVKKREC